jgi:hypothetical protein
MHVEQIIATHPQARGRPDAALIRCIEECYDCAQTCTACADACLGEEMVRDLVQCVRTCQDCADLCLTTGAIATRRTGSNEATVRAVLDACAVACRLCGDECETHAAHHEHCRICADACDRCEQACREAARTFEPVLQ